LSALIDIATAAEPVVWRLENPSTIGELGTTVLGRPSTSKDGLVFDGARDGVLVPTNPLAGWEAFTIEILFSPTEGGAAEQRFLHLEDTNGARSLIELRMNAKGEWWLDTFLRDDEARLTLIDSQKRHPAGKWYWAALRYDGHTMTHFVNGEKECEGQIAFRPMIDGRVSIGMRQNQVFWFKGVIREVRFSPVALPVDRLQRSQ
jgi:hypothetical protein